ncbi:nucleoside phosphorylase [Halobaculum sp. MBLA0143]|uniref:nucleoside phosphorylase n=1 Tax=Halobaculum sp. MBLA0143 TaxID=3079933 RepID=UPI003523C52E
MSTLNQRGETGSSQHDPARSDDDDDRPKPTLPNYTDKYHSEALFDPTDAVTAHGDGLPDVPPVVLLGFQEALHEAVEERATEEVSIVRSQSLYRLSETVGFVPVQEAGISAPVAAIVAENLVAAGAEVVLVVAGSGTLQASLDPDTVVLPTRAIRDEGVSHHYLPPTAELTPTESVVASVASALHDAGFDTARGPTWTTSALYRETVAEVERYTEAGVVSVGMETAAVWAVCRYRDVATATVHLVDDCLTSEEWRPEGTGRRSLPELLDPVIEGVAATVK